MRVRNSRGRFVSVATLVDRVNDLKRAGFYVAYAWPEDAARFGYLSSSSIDGEYAGGYRVHTVTGDPSQVYGFPYVSFGDVARGEDSYGQSDTVARSNYSAIRRDFPKFPWVDTSYLNVNELGCFVADLDDDMMSLFIGLKECYPVYDESAMSDLESDEIHESWAEWMRGDIWSELPEVTRTTMWDTIGEDMITELWWGCVSHEVFGSYPEHRGVEITWGDTRERTADFRDIIIRAYVTIRRGLNITDGYEFVRLTQRLKGKGY